MKEHYCKYCGKSTYDVDIDYLVGHDHLTCALNQFNLDRKERLKNAIKIENWHKLNGVVFKVCGVDLVFKDFEQPYRDTTELGLNGFSDFYRGRICEYSTNDFIGNVSLFTLDMEIEVKTDFGEVKYGITKENISTPDKFIELVSHLLVSDSRISGMLDIISESSKIRNMGTGYSPGPGIHGSSGNNLW